jgi:glucan biosynthesis protein C
MGSYGRTLHHPEPLQLIWSSLLSGRWVRHFDTTHLWFLNYLLWLYLLTAVVRWFARPLSGWVDLQFGKLLTNWLCSAYLAFLTFLTLCSMRIGLLDTENDWIPVPNILLAYWLFYGFGWLLFHHRGQLAGWTRGAWTKVLLTLPLAFVNLLFVRRQMQAGPDRDWIAFLGTAATGAVVVWLMIFGLTGLFLRYGSAENNRWRYLSDSAYWQYVMHPPVVLSLQLAFAPVAASSFTKCAIVTALSLAVLLLTYDWFARSTWIGILLNGRRYPRALTFPRAVPRPVPVSAPSIDLDPAT